VHLHTSAHQELNWQLKAMRQFGSGSGDAQSLLRFIANWLACHILGMDQSMARQIQAIRSGVAAKDAFERDRLVAADPAIGRLLDSLNSLFYLNEPRQQAIVDIDCHAEHLVEQGMSALSREHSRLVAEASELRSAVITVGDAQRRLLDSERKRALEAHRHMRQLLSQIVDGDPVPTFVIDANHRVTHWNKACAGITGMAAAQMIGTNRQWLPFYGSERPTMADLIVGGETANLEQFYAGKYKASKMIEGAYEAEDFFPRVGDSGCWLYFTAAPLRDRNGRIIGAIETLQDVTERQRAVSELQRHQACLEELIETRTAELADANRQLGEDIARREAAEAELLRRYAELTELNITLSDTRDQLLQSEKLASIGQLSAGVAHEINNPIGYVHSNIGTLERYLGDLFRVLDAYQAAETAIADDRVRSRLQGLRREIDLGFLMEDIPILMEESKEGITRVKRIVQDLKDFSRMDTSGDWQWTDIHQAIDSTINIVGNEVKYRADIVKEYGALPKVQCLPSQMKQVVMNLLVNAAHAIDGERGIITIRTKAEGARVLMEIADNGSGIPEAIRTKVFDPFFTTKPVGKGTGLGLSLSYGIIQKHGGSIEIDSAVGVGTTFRISLPVEQQALAVEG
jgi:two-component system, NtrC family, sensor kinase